MIILKAMDQYNFKKIEAKWQKIWEKNKAFFAKDFSKKQKYYSLMEFPYPSGEGLHVGHTRGFTAMDIISRKRRMEGYNVLFPIGWDAFGLPTENYAIKAGIHPKIATKKNTDTFRKQLKSLGFSFDWSREINTTDPNYYKWTQWIFLQLFKKGLAYKNKIAINWCPSCKIGLANEEVVDSKCERCGTAVEKREKEQWLLKITKYADRLLKDLDKVDYLEKIKIQQQNWIGKSEGAEINFQVSNSNFQIKVFTTRADTIFGATYMVLSPEHSLIENLKLKIKNFDEVKKYIAEAKKKSEMQRTDLTKEKTGVELKGIKAINPATKKEISIWVADYVLAGYGTGAIMAVPAHDERDFEFAKKYNLPIIEVIEPLITREIGEDAFQKNKPINERRSVVAVIKHWSENKYLGAIWKKTGWQGFVIGGIEANENSKTAGLREITEETGYKNVEFVKALPGIINARFFQKVKNQNRLAHFEPVLFKLKDGEMVEVAEKEKVLQDLKWLKPEEFENFITHADMQIVWQRAMGNYFYIGDGEIVSGCSWRGLLVNSGKFDGMDSEKAKSEIIKFIGAKKAVQYHLRDWIFSRQHYWGEPIPMIYCEKHKWQPVAEKDLPIKLPEVKKYQPTDTGESPLANIKNWVNTKCPKCGNLAKRETDTMPNWAGSSWYFLRYCDPHNKKSLADIKKLKYWMPINWYNGGMEHTTLHLLYSRFWNKFLYDIKVAPTSEPYQKRTSHGMILGEDGEKMSKSRGNVINPDEIVKNYGADAYRIYQMFIGPFDQAIPWNSRGIEGAKRFLNKVWNLRRKILLSSPPAPKLRRAGIPVIETLLHQTIKKVGEDIEAMKFNTAISSLMILVNEMEKEKNLPATSYKLLITLLYPFAPHLASELAEKLKFKIDKWPKFDPKKIKEETFQMVVQINGKLRARIGAPMGISQKEAEVLTLETENVKNYLRGKKVKKIVFIPNRLINIVI